MDTSFGMLCLIAIAAPVAAQPSNEALCASNKGQDYNAVSKNAYNGFRNVHCVPTKYVSGKYKMFYIYESGVKFFG